MNEMINTAMKVMKMADLEKEEKLAPFEKEELARLRQKLMGTVLEAPLRVSDPFGLLNEDTE
jgi:uncharacterized protein YnzC (UPF0291/DUF896 family)